MVERDGFPWSRPSEDAKDEFAAYQKEIDEVFNSITKDIVIDIPDRPFEHLTLTELFHEVSKTKRWLMKNKHLPKPTNDEGRAAFQKYKDLLEEGKIRAKQKEEDE